jgi:hypothetical protein
MQSTAARLKPHTFTQVTRSSCTPSPSQARAVIYAKITAQYKQITKCDASHRAFGPGNIPVYGSKEATP